MSPLACALAALAAVVAGVVLGWRARASYAPWPKGWAVLCPDRDTAALTWRNGTRIVFSDGFKVRELTEIEIQECLAARFREARREFRA